VPFAQCLAITGSNSGAGRVYSYMTNGSNRHINKQYGHRESLYSLDSHV